MPTFRYVVRNPQGRIYRDSIDIDSKRVLLEDSAVPGQQHVIAVLVANAPLGEPVGTIFMRYATLAFE